MEGRTPRYLRIADALRQRMIAFASERVSYASDGGPTVFDRVFNPGDRFRITREFRYEGAPR
jgi:DNA-binding GntR family transcriptional regulator